MTIDWNAIEAIAAVAAVVLPMLGAGIVYAGKVLKTFVAMQASLHTIATNDLPHIYGEIKDLRKEFIEFIREDSFGQAEISYTGGDHQDSARLGHHSGVNGGGVRELQDQPAGLSGDALGLRNRPNVVRARDY